jgi:S-adenosylmethionine hydrolase
VAPPVITFLSDYGLADEFVGICHAVMVAICPEARVIDVSHGIPRHDVRAGALILRGMVAFTLAGAVHLAVVDPDVGAQRRAVALRAADGRAFVGPDNGLLWLAAEASGGVVESVDIARSPLRLEPVSATFHGRDIFAPVAAHLAAGTPIAEVGDPCDPDDLVRLELRAPRFLDDGTVEASAIYVDRFGNVQLNVEHEELARSALKLGRALELDVGSGSVHRATFARTFAEVEPGALLVYEDAARRLAVAVSHGDAARRLGVGVEDSVRIRPA